MFKYTQEVLTTERYLTKQVLGKKIVKNIYFILKKRKIQYWYIRLFTAFFACPSLLFHVVAVSSM